MQGADGNGAMAWKPDAVAALPIGSIPYRYNLFSALAAGGAAALVAWAASVGPPVLYYNAFLYSEPVVALCIAIALRESARRGQAIHLDQ